MKTGFVTVIGLPNVGKSTIINMLVGKKVAITSPKPQTTRNKILGIYNDEAYQIIFADTPGVFKPRNELGDFMMKSTKEAAKDVDLIIVVGDASKGVINEDKELIDKYSRYGAPVIYALNKIDLIKPDNLLYELNKLNENEVLSAVIPISCRKEKNLDVLLSEIKKHIPLGPMYYEKEDYTDKPIEFLIAEVVREKALIYLQQEIPHGIMTAVERMYESNDILHIDIVIVADRNSHKPIIIGKGGSTIKKIGESARKELERILSKHIALTTFVRIDENWRSKASRLSEFGYKK